MYSKQFLFLLSFAFLLLLGASACGDDDDDMTTPGGGFTLDNASITYDVDGQSGAFSAFGSVGVVDTFLNFTYATDSSGVILDTFINAETLLITVLNIDTSASSQSQVFGLWIVGYDGPGNYGPLTDLESNTPRGFSYLAVSDGANGDNGVTGYCGGIFTTVYDQNTTGTVVIDSEDIAQNRVAGTFDVDCDDGAGFDNLSGSFLLN